MNHLPTSPSLEVTIQWPWYPWDKWGNVMDMEVYGMLYSTHTWDLVWAIKSASPASCKTPATSTDSICPNNFWGFEMGIFGSLWRYSVSGCVANTLSYSQKILCNLNQVFRYKYHYSYYLLCHRSRLLIKSDYWFVMLIIV